MSEQWGVNDKYFAFIFFFFFVFSLFIFMVIYFLVFLSLPLLLSMTFFILSSETTYGARKAGKHETTNRTLVRDPHDNTATHHYVGMTRSHTQFRHIKPWSEQQKDNSSPPGVGVVRVGLVSRVKMGLVPKVVQQCEDHGHYFVFLSLYNHDIWVVWTPLYILYKIFLGSHCRPGARTYPRFITTEVGAVNPKLW